MNNKGFTLIEALIAMGLITITSMVFAQLSINSALSQNYNDFRLSSNSLASSISNSITNVSNCTQAFQGIPFASTGKPVAVTLVLPNRTLSAGVAVPSYNLSISDLSFTNYKLVQTNTDGGLVYFGDLSMTTTPTRKVLGGNIITVVVSSFYITASNGLVVNCGGQAPVSPSPSPSPSITASPIPSPVSNGSPCDNQNQQGQQGQK